MLGPLSRTLGPAVLAFLPNLNDAQAPDTTDVTTLGADDPRLSALATRSGEDDAGESDVRQWPGPVSVLVDGSAAADVKVWAPAAAGRNC